MSITAVAQPNNPATNTKPTDFSEATVSPHTFVSRPYADGALYEATITYPGGRGQLTMDVPHLYDGRSTSYEWNGDKLNMQAIKSWQQVSNAMLDAAHKARSENA